MEAVQDARKHVVKLAYDGLIFKKLATNSKWPLLAASVISVSLEAVLSTFNLVGLLAFIHLSTNAHLGLTVAYRRYCIGTRLCSVAPAKTVGHQNMASLQDSDSDDTDIDVAVDEYKTQVYVSTVMEWNGSEMTTASRMNSSDDTATSSVKSRNCLLIASFLILVISVTSRCIVSNSHPVLIGVAVVTLIAFVVVLIVTWLHPQKARAQNATFKVPCVPWIPVGSSLFHYVLLYQLPWITWGLATLWLLIGTVHQSIRIL